MVLAEDEYLLECGSLFKRGNVALFALFLFLDSGFETVSQSGKNVIPDDRSEAREIRNLGKRGRIVNSWIPDRGLSRIPGNNQ